MFINKLGYSKREFLHEQQPYLSSPGQKGSSSGSGKKLQDFKQTFFATWSRGTSSKKRQPQIQHHTTSGSNLAHTGTQDYMMMPQGRKIFEIESNCNYYVIIILREKKLSDLHFRTFFYSKLNIFQQLSFFTRIIYSGHFEFEF